MMNYKVLITTSGTGSRLQELTKNTNKALIKINDQATLNYIIDIYPQDVPLVVTLGYLGEQVKEHLLKKYSNRKFEFVHVPKFEGSGSSLGYSMLQAKSELQCPFVFQSCDTIVVDDIPPPSHNWMAGFVTEWKETDLQLSQYRTHKVVNNKIIKLNDKGDVDFNSIHIGLIGIHDYALFWQTLEELYKQDPSHQDLSDVQVLDKMIAKGADFHWLPFRTWFDTGNLQALQKTRKEFENV